MIWVCWYQARIQEFTLVGAPWIGEGSGDRQGPQRVQGRARWGALGGEPPVEAHENWEFEEVIETQKWLYFRRFMLGVRPQRLH